MAWTCPTRVRSTHNTCVRNAKSLATTAAVCSSAKLPGLTSVSLHQAVTFSSSHCRVHTPTPKLSRSLWYRTLTFTGFPCTLWLGFHTKLQLSHRLIVHPDRCRTSCRSGGEKTTATDVNHREKKDWSPKRCRRRKVWFNFTAVNKEAFTQACECTLGRCITVKLREWKEWSTTNYWNKNKKLSVNFVKMGFLRLYNVSGCTCLFT